MGSSTRMISGHRVRFTSLDRVMYPHTQTTKGDVVDYYMRVSPLLIAHACDRAATRKRWIEGTGTADSPGDAFFHRSLDEDAPSWVRHYAVRHQERTIQYPLLNDEATVAWFAQRASLEFHVPQWRFAKGGRALPPDRLVLDLDPGEGRGLQDCARVASLARERLDDVGLVAVPVTSGSKGVHVYAALDGSRSSDEATEVAHAIAEELESTNPELVVASMDKDRRRGKVFIDWSQNRATKTTITPYSLRGRVRPWVAAPRTWAELEADDFSQLTHHDVLERIEDGNDLLAPLLGDSSHQTE